LLLAKEQNIIELASGERPVNVILKDIDIMSPHAAHIRLLKNLSTSSIRVHNRKPITVSIALCIMAKFVKYALNKFL
jgi:hypothetical protein